MVSVENFVEMPFKSQLHQCCLLYCKANGLQAFSHRKPSTDYFKCRAYLNKIPTQEIKNIAIMLMKEQKPVYLYDLQKSAAAYVERERAEENKRKIDRLEFACKKGYDMDSALMDFLE